jgi:hypothetical protein
LYTIYKSKKKKKKTLSNTSILLGIYWNLNIEKPVRKKEKENSLNPNFSFSICKFKNLAGKRRRKNNF